jgi:Zn-dependent protease
MSFVQIAMILLIAALILIGGTRGVTWMHLRGRRLAVPRIRPVDPADLPAALAPVFETAGQELVVLGFAPTGARWVGSVDACEGPRPELVYGHAESGALAFVGPPLPGMGDRPYRVSFVTSLTSGDTVATFDGVAHLTPGFPAGWECQDHDLNDLGRQWALHLGALEAHGGLESTRHVQLDEWNGIEADALTSAMERWETEGTTARVRGTKDGIRWRFRTLAAWHLAATLIAGQRRLLQREAEAARVQARRELWRSSLDAVTDPLQPGLERARAAAMGWSYEYAREADAKRRNSRTTINKWIVGLSSAGACLAVFAIWFGWELASLLCGVLLLHEIGHVTVMAAFGYRDRRILFLPFFGAAAMGEKHDATPAQRTMVLLAGPVPGLLVGILCLYLFSIGGGLWWLALATTSLIVNYFNLLPIPPLDGGRVVETLLLGRFPRAQVFFLGGGALTLGLGAWVFRDPILAAMALALLISLRAAWAAANGLLRARERLEPGMSASDRIRAVFETLQEAPFADSPPAQRVRLAELIVPRLETPAARRPAALAGAIVYLGLLVGTPAAVAASIYAFQPQLWELLVESTRPDASNAMAGQSSSVTITEASVVGR